MPGPPAAFLSYARFNDRHDDGWVTDFCECLSEEVQVQLGEEFPIFQDRKDIAWGQSWQERIDEALDAVTLLVVIITPGFFRSPACRAEVERFLARERELGRNDLILPVYYVSTPDLDDPERHEGDELARVLRSRQFADWRELRFEPLTSPRVRKAVAQLGTRMRDTFWRSTANPPSGAHERVDQAAKQPQSAEDAPTTRVSVKADPRAREVDAPVVGGQTRADSDNARSLKQAKEHDMSDGRLLELVCQALESAFTYGELERFLRFRFDRRLSQIVAGATDYEDVCFKLADTSHSQGWLEDLVREAVDYRPFSKTLRNLQEILGTD